MPLAIDDDRVELACFEVRGQLFGIDVQQIREIVRSQVVTPLPKAPGLIEGVIDLRGTIVPVIDLGRALCGEPIAEGTRARTEGADWLEENLFEAQSKVSLYTIGRQSFLEP